MSEEKEFSGLTGQEILDKIESSDIASFDIIPGDLVTVRNISSSPFKAALEAFKSEGNTEKVKEMEYEIILFDFMLTDPTQYVGEKYNRFSPIFVSPDGICYPDIKKIGNNEKQYYKMRGEQTKNPELKARYCDFTWEHLNDHKHAKMAVESYLSLLDPYYKSKYYLGVADCLPRSLQIAARLNDEALIKKCIIAHFKYLKKYTDINELRWLHEILESLLMFKRLKEFVNFDDIDPYFNTAIEGCGYDIINRVGSIEKRIKLLKIFDRKELIGKAQEDIGLAYEMEADRRKKDPIISSMYLDNAIKHYSKINKQFGVDYTDKLDSLKIMIKEVNRESKSHMQTFSMESEIPTEQIEEYVNHFKTLSIDASLGLIASEFPIMLSRNNAIEIAKDSLQETPLLAVITETVMSDDNISGEIKAGEQKIEKFAKEIVIQNCFSVIQLYIYPVFDLLLKEKNFNCKELLNFISCSNLIEKYRLPILEVGIDRFFENDYISSIHILVFQIEGILRDVLGRIGRPSSKLTRYGATQEKLLDEILRDERLKKSLGEDFCYFLQVILSDPLGVNLRNRVGHALAKFEEFNRATSTLLLLILIRFGILRYSNTQDTLNNKQPDSKGDPDA